LRRSMPIAPEDGSKANAKVMRQPLGKSRLRHILQLPVGSPCPCSNSTKPSLPQTTRPSNWRIQHRNRTAPQWAQWAQPWHNRHLDSGSPFHELCNTTPFWQQTNPPANLRIRLGNCRDLLGVVVPSADHRYDDSCSTRSAWLHPNPGKIPPRNCTDQQVRVALWVVREAESGAELRVEFAVAWVAAWVAAWEMVWVGLSALSPAKL